MSFQRKLESLDPPATSPSRDIPARTGRPAGAMEGFLSRRCLLYTYQVRCTDAETPETKGGKQWVTKMYTWKNKGDLVDTIAVW